MEPTPGGTLESVNTMLADPLFSIVARLAKGPIDAQDSTLDLTTLVEADFPGYAPIPIIANLDGAQEVEGYGEMAPQRLRWEVGAIVTPQRISHIYYTKSYNGGGVSLAGGTAFDNPPLMYAPGQVFELDAVIAGVTNAT